MIEQIFEKYVEATNQSEYEEACAQIDEALEALISFLKMIEEKEQMFFVTTDGIGLMNIPAELKKKRVIN